MKRIISVLFVILLVCITTGCSDQNEQSNEVAITEQKYSTDTIDGFIYNPDRDEYYDPLSLTWDEEKQEYIYLTPDPALWCRNPVEEIPYDGTIPEELMNAFEEYDKVMHEYYQEKEETDPFWEFRSFHPIDNENGAYHALCSVCVKHWEPLYEIAASDGEYSGKAELAISGILTNGLSGNSVYAASFLVTMREMYYQPATEAVNALGEKITAKDCEELQKVYGYMIAPALKAIGKLDLLQIDPNSPCADPEQLAAFAEYFA